MKGSASAPNSGDDRGHALRHQPGDECDIPREPVELGDQHRAFRLAGCGEGCGKLRPAIERIGSLAGFDLGEFLKKGDAGCFGEASDCRSLSLDAQT
jgi:hypothetical protein